MTKRLTPLQKRVRAENRAFNKLPKADQRIAIAQDVIAQLNSGRFKATRGTYVAIGVDLTEHDLNKDTSEVLANVEQCHVCGVGSLFVSAVCKADNLPLHELDIDIDTDYNQMDLTGTDTFNYLRRFFDNDQLQLIEREFEVWEGSYFAPKVKEAKTRMRLIMENIIANGGTFDPYIQPVRAWVTPNYKG